MQVSASVLKMKRNNDPKHPSKSTKKHRNQKKVSVFEWPSQRPDLSPTKHLWGDLKQTVHRKWHHNLTLTTNLVNLQEYVTLTYITVKNLHQSYYYYKTELLKLNYLERYGFLEPSWLKLSWYSIVSISITLSWNLDSSLSQVYAESHIWILHKIQPPVFSGLFQHSVLHFLQDCLIFKFSLCTRLSNIQSTVSTSVSWHSVSGFHSSGLTFNLNISTRMFDVHFYFRQQGLASLVLL